MDTQLHGPALRPGLSAHVRVGYKTDKGHKRANNEDSHAVFMEGELGPELEFLLVVADGMGGTKGGEIASNIVVNSLPEALQTRLVQAAAQGVKDKPARAALLLTEAIWQANGEVWRYKVQHTGLENMGTTCVAAVLSQNIVTIGNVGDSRAYLLRAGRLHQITEDHSEVWEQVKAGRMTPQQAATSRFRNTITRAMGLRDDVAPDVTAHPLEDGDALLLCSDGLTTEVDDAAIATLLAQSPDPQSACDRLVAQALQNGGSDNVTVVVLHYGAFVPGPGQPAPSVPAAPFHTTEQTGAGRAIASEDDDITDPNQAWKRSLSPARSLDADAPQGSRGKHRNGRNDAEAGEDRYARSSRRFHEAAPAAQRGGIAPWLFALALLAVIGEGVALGLFWTGRFKPRPAPVVAPPAVVKPTDRPLTYPGIVVIYKQKPLWNGLLQITPDDRIMAVTQDGHRLLITRGGSAAEQADVIKLPPAPPLRTPEGLLLPAPVLPAVAFDASGYRYELNPATRAIDKYDQAGTLLLANIGKGRLLSPAGLAVDRGGSLYVIDTRRLKRIAAVPDVGQSAASPAPQTASPQPVGDPANSAAGAKEGTAP